MSCALSQGHLQIVVWLVKSSGALLLSRPGDAHNPPHFICVCPTPCSLLLSHVVFVVAAPSFNEQRLLVYHSVSGRAAAGGAVYLHLKVRTAQP